MLLSTNTSPSAPDFFSSLQAICRAALEGNVVEINGRRYLAAGQNQFHALWTRDFCFSAPALLQMGRDDVVRDHLGALIERARPSDGLIPRVMDSVDTRLRVVFRVLSGRLSKGHRWPPIRHLRPEYFGEHGTLSMDSNILVLRAAAQYFQATGDIHAWRDWQPHLQRIFAFYEGYWEDGLLQQGPFEDWQDSANRSGATFYLNLLFQTVTQQLEAVNFNLPPGNWHQQHRQRLNEVFWDSQVGLFRSVMGWDGFSLDALLLALKDQWVTGAEASGLYDRLKKNALWQTAPLPAMATIPDYPPEWISWTARLVGLGRYHGGLLWSWLMGLSAEVAIRMGDIQAAQSILRKVSELALRDQTIYEIYQPKEPLQPFQTWTYRSEAPFSWGAAAILEALRAYPKASFVTRKSEKPSNEAAGEKPTKA